MIPMTPVNSSTIESVGFDEATAELHILFLKTGKTYVYRGASRQLFDELLNAPSQGVFLNTVIKPAFPDYYVL